MAAELKNTSKNSGRPSIWQLGAAKSRMSRSPNVDDEVEWMKNFATYGVLKFVDAPRTGFFSATWFSEKPLDHHSSA